MAGRIFRSKAAKLVPVGLPYVIDEGSVPEGQSLSSHLLTLQNEGMPEAQIGAAMVAFLRAMADIMKRPDFLGEVVVTSDNIHYDVGGSWPFRLLNSSQPNAPGLNPRFGLYGLGIVAMKMAFGATGWEAVQLGGEDVPQRLLDLGNGFKKIWAEKVKGKKGQVSVEGDGPGLLINDEQADLRYLELKKGNNKTQAKIRRFFGKRQENGAGIALSPEFVDFVIKLLELDGANPRSIPSLESHRFLKNYI